jgi:hypothetical protein
VASVTTSRGAKPKLSMLYGSSVSMRVVSADIVDLPDPLRRALTRSQARREWTSLEEVRALLVRVKTPVSDTPSRDRSPRP